MSDYLKPGMRGAFSGMNRKKIAPYLREIGAVFKCPQCRGYGGWNLELNSYGKGKHFQASCSHCNGWGYVDKDSSDHVHKWAFSKNLGPCYSEYTCNICGIKRNVDSS